MLRVKAVRAGSSEADSNGSHICTTCERYRVQSIGGVTVGTEHLILGTSPPEIQECCLVDAAFQIVSGDL